VQETTAPSDVTLVAVCDVAGAVLNYPNNEFAKPQTNGNDAWNNNVLSATLETPRDALTWQVHQQAKRTVTLLYLTSLRWLTIMHHAYNIMSFIDTSHCLIDDISDFMQIRSVWLYDICYGNVEFA